MKIHKFRRKCYRIKINKDKVPTRIFGNCDDPEEKKKLIMLNVKGLAPEKILEIAFHEGLHASNWDLDEGAVEEMAECSAKFAIRVIKELGFEIRKKELKKFKEE